jgi:DNA-binding transcriptional regulator/RsmH inhibitor MraZ
MRVQSKLPARFNETFLLKVSRNTNQIALPRCVSDAVVERNEGYLVLIPSKNARHWRLLTQRAFSGLVENIQISPDLPEKVRKKVASRLCSVAYPIEWDTQRRFSLPKEFVESMADGDEVLLKGAGDHLELWPNPADATANQGATRD